jgi:hypothetical protein
MQGLRESDREAYEVYRAIFERLDRVLTEQGLPRHQEPDEIVPEYRISFGMFGYSGLRYLRRIAAHKQFSGTLPAPGDEKAPKDLLLKKYYAQLDAQQLSPESRPRNRGLLGFLRRVGQAVADGKFDYLINHSDCESFYLPIDFKKVFIADLGPEMQWQQVGSAYCLLQECKVLAEFIGIPDDVDAESEALRNAIENQGNGNGWQRYGIESFTCIRLMRASQASIASGAALVFC